ncbi:hypothetical protein ZWY2020_025599 [Hordeum vulgare]|nr:hypothetical protein ZWY2020_025599 [Hordeum vulgare]
MPYFTKLVFLRIDALSDRYGPPINLLTRKADPDSLHPTATTSTAPPSSAPAPASSPSAASPALLDLNCTATGGDHERQETYPSTHPFSVLAGGEDLLCAVGPSSARAGAVDMRWWDLSKKAGRSKRVYLGPRLRALASSGYRVCGVLSSGELHCSWSWGCSVTVQGGNSE